jgi:hypothetical protein
LAASLSGLAENPESAGLSRRSFGPHDEREKDRQQFFCRH